MSITCVYGARFSLDVFNPIFALATNCSLDASICASFASFSGPSGIALAISQLLIILAATSLILAERSLFAVNTSGAVRNSSTDSSVITANCVFVFSIFCF